MTGLSTVDKTYNTQSTVYRVPRFLTSRPNWGPPHPQASVAPLLDPGGDTLACGGGGWGDPIQTTDTLYNTV
jgi:hypothetical protein